MNRIGLTLLLVLFSQTLQAADDAAPLPTTPPPQVAIATATDNAGRVLIALTTQRMVKESRVRVVVVNGKNVEEEYEAERPIYETQEIETDGSAKVYDRNGVVVDQRTLPVLLKKDTPVLLTSDGKLDRFYRKLYRDEILVLAWQDRKEARDLVPLAPDQALLQD